MLKLPGEMTAERFLANHWQKKPLLMPQAMARVQPAVTRNELAWLATLDDVESRLVLIDRDGGKVRYRAESGPFDEEFLAALPPRDWTLLVHDVEKHLPTMRRLFAQVPFIPDWRIDDLMVSFAAPGGGVGPHCDNYDVFLCQGIGVRDWHATTTTIDADPRASNDLSLTREFAGELQAECRNGDVLYLPPGVAHWGTARRACITYSIGMRAPQQSDLVDGLPDEERANPFYTDPDLAIGEALPGYISPAAAKRATHIGGASSGTLDDVAESLGRFVTEPKQWLAPALPSVDEVTEMLNRLKRRASLRVHGMTRIAWDDSRVFVNGQATRRPPGSSAMLREACAERRIRLQQQPGTPLLECIAWLARSGCFEIPEPP